ncbi:MAG: DUF2007 domain-containing protein [Pseudomonadota bacterium]
MKELLRTNDPVLLSWLMARLEEAAIEAVVFDAHMSVLEGSIGVLPRRLMVMDEDFARAQAIVEEAEGIG